MTDQPTDKLFRQKLENLSRPAPPRAWSRIEAGLHKKKNKVVWLRVAAVVVPLAVASFFTWSAWQTYRTRPLISENDTVKEAPAAPQESRPSEKNEAGTKKQGPAPAIAGAEKDDADTPHAEKDAAPSAAPLHKAAEPEPPRSVNPAVENEAAAQPETAVAVTPPPAEAPAVAAEPAEEKSFKLVIDAEEANDRYLNKKLLAKATTEEQKSSGLKKLLNKAYDLKTNQDPIGELRQMKNEILALSFQGNKKHEQNK